MSASQKGRGVKIDTRPTFSGYIVIDFPENDKFRLYDEIEDENGLICTRVGNDSTQELTAKLVLETSTSAPSKFDVLSETSPSTRKWLITEISRPRQAGQKYLLDVKLIASEGTSLS